MTDHNDLGETLNAYGEVATHADCGDHESPGRGKCEGWLCYWENPNTGNTRLLCAAHAELADKRQAQIHRDYLNDTVYSPDY